MQGHARTLLKYFPDGTGCYEGLYGPNFIVFCIGEQRIGKLTKYGGDLYHITAYLYERVGSLAEIEEGLAEDEELKKKRYEAVATKLNKVVEYSRRVSQLFTGMTM